MSKSNGALGAAGKVITYLLVVLLILGIAGGIAYFFMRSQGMTFYVEYGGTKYLANGESGSIKLLNGTSSAFTVKSLTGEEVNYSVKVMSNGANNFSFTVNGEIWYLWNDDETKDDYTDIFEVEKNADSFTLTLADGFTVKQAIEEKYGAEIVPQTDIQFGLCYFIIVVTVDESTVSLWFTFDVEVESIVLNPPSIVF